MRRKKASGVVGRFLWTSFVPHERDPRKVQHDRREQVRQRLYQIALGYPDCNDADRVRQDPLLKSVCDRSPQAAGLSSQPTLSRLENAVDMRTLRTLVREIGEQYVRSFTETPDVIVLDIDSTDDPTHGQPQLSCFPGYYDQHMYHPLLIFDEARLRFQATKQTVQHFDAFAYATETWPQARHVVMKAEVSEHGANPRFVVTSLPEFAPALLYPAYCERNRYENFIKDFKNAMQADRLSCSTFAANFFRLLEHAAAYVLFPALRTQGAPLAPQLGRAQFDTLQLQLLGDFWK